jgi:hypothetical protein
VKNCVDQGIGSLTHPCLKMNRLQKKWEVFSNSTNPVESWDKLKIVINDFCVKFPQKISHSFKRKIKFIQEELNKIEDLPYNQIDMNRKKKTGTWIIRID